jgi:Porin subfamily
MKMVKSLFLGTAAGLVAMTGAQAADLPVKAKPVQYVKICSLYGAGFYYIPGTDMCLKIGGYVRQQIDWNTNGNLTAGPMVNNANSRGTQNFAERSRGYITADARNQTEYGTVRSYIAVGLSASNTTNAASNDTATNTIGFSANRAFIQFAGFTFGLSQSYYDFFPTPALSYFGGSIYPSSDTGDAGRAVTAYTAQFGNGLSGTISLEAQRNTAVFSGNGTAITFSAPTSSGIVGSSVASLATNSQKAEQFPDVVANLRLDQAWGGAQVMAAIHDTSEAYYLTSTTNGNPSDALGFAVGAGIKLNAPMIGTGDYFDAQATYSNGATGFNHTNGGSYVFFNPGSTTVGAGVVTDNVVGGSSAANGTGNNLTTAWSVDAAYEHFWSKSYQTSVYGGYVKYMYNTQANNILCSAEGLGAGIGTAALANPGCNNNFAYYIIGSRSQWNVDSQTYLGVDIAYLGLQTANSGLFSNPMNASGTAALGANVPNATRTFANQGTFMGQFRIHRNFYP